MRFFGGGVGRRYLSGKGGQVLYPIVPKRLSQIIKTEMFDNLSTKEISTVWNGHFGLPTSNGLAIGTTLLRSDWELFFNRIQKSPSFIFPVQNLDNPETFYFLYSEWQQNLNYIAMTYLEDFKNNPAKAEPYMIIQPFKEFLEKKDVVLFYSEFLPYLTKPQARNLQKSVLHFYSRDDKFEHVSKFNSKTDSRSFELQKAFPYLKLG